jgi:Skp family chaperone for outer membrane proteins
MSPRISASPLARVSDFLGRLALVLLCLAGPAFAQDGTGQVILVINQDRIFTGSKLGQLIIAADEAQKAELAALGERLSRELEAEEKALTEQRETLEPAEFRILAEAFDKKVVGIRADQDKMAEDLVAAIDGRRRQFYTQIGSVLLAVMQERKADVILDQRSVVLSARAVNVTEDVIARIDASFRTLADIGITE